MMYQWGFPDSACGKEPACQCKRHEMWVRSLGQEDTLEEAKATHSNILAWSIPWGEEPEPGRLWSIGSQESDVTEVTQHRTTELHVSLVKSAFSLTPSGITELKNLCKLG